jgi:hypothetical protein
LKYEGEIGNRKPIGQGTYTCNNGEKYTGKIKHAARHGRGTYIFDWGRYEGNWMEGGPNARSAENCPIPIPNLLLPKLTAHHLVSVPDRVLPDLPDWHYSRFIPEDLSWLDSAGKLYKEGINSLYQGNPKEALNQFRAVTGEYPETPWFAPSLFWQGQILAKRKEYASAGKILTVFLDSLKRGTYSARNIEFQNFSRYTLAWLALKQKKYIEAMEIIEKNKEVISFKKIRVQLLFLKYLIHVQLKQSDLAFEVIDDLIQLFPYDFEHVVRLAEFYFVENRWQELADLVEAQTRYGNEGWNEGWNEPQMEHFLWLGVAANMKSKQWSKVKKTLISLENHGVRNSDELYVAYLKVYLLQANEMELAWFYWSKINDEIVKGKALRQLIHHAIRAKDFQFLLKMEPELKLATKYWRTWRGELKQIYIYLYLRQGLNGNTNIEKLKYWAGEINDDEEFRNEDILRKGTITLSDFSNYVGQIKNGKPHGLGTETLSNGIKYVGKWEMGILSEGIQYSQKQLQLRHVHSKGNIIGMWVNGKIVGKWVNGKWQPFLEAHDKAEKNVGPYEAEKDDNTAKAKQQALMATEFIEEMRKDGFMD